MEMVKSSRNSLKEVYSRRYKLLKHVWEEGNSFSSAPIFFATCNLGDNFFQPPNGSVEHPVTKRKNFRRFSSSKLTSVSRKYWIVLEFSANPLKLICDLSSSLDHGFSTIWPLIRFLTSVLVNIDSHLSGNTRSNPPRRKTLLAFDKRKCKMKL